MDFLNSIPYKLGSTFEENNIDLELREELKNNVNFYINYRYSEIYLFGKIFESVCYLWFSKGILDTIEYRFHKRYFELFKGSINDELPLNHKLTKDPFIKSFALESYVGKVVVSLVELNKDFFLLKLSNYPSLRRT